MTLETLQLSAADFDDLAGGEGSPGAIAVLRAGQLNRRLLLLRALMDRARTAAGEAFDASGLDRSYDLLAEIQAVDPHAVTAVLLAPGVGVWLARCVARLDGAAPVEHRGEHDTVTTEFSYLATVAAAAAVRARHPCTVPVRARDGAVLLPTLGRARVAPAGSASWQAATVESGPREATVRCDGESVRLPIDHRCDAPGWQGVRQLVAAAGEQRLTVDIDDLGTSLGAGEPQHGRLTGEELACWQRRFADAVALLAADHPAQLTAIAASLGTIIPLCRGPRGVSMSTTSHAAFGALGMALSDTPADLAETLVHELAHAKLYALHDLVPLYSDDSGALHHSPWRRDPRPLSGLMHGAYAFLAVCDFYRRQAARDHGGRPLDCFEYTLKRRQVAATIETILCTGELTPRGVEFVEQMRATLNRWTACGDAEISTLARQASNHHRVRWRLDNVSLDPDEVLRLAAAWVSGAASPIRLEGIDGTVEAGQRRGGRGPLVRLMRLRLEEPERFSLVANDPTILAEEATEASLATAADVAHVRGDHPAAERLYRRQLAEEPDAPEHWAGLAVAVGELRDDPASRALTTRPEVVRAVSEQVTKMGAPAPDPVRLAAWLGSSESRPL